MKTEVQARLLLLDREINGKGLRLVYTRKPLGQIAADTLVIYRTGSDRLVAGDGKRTVADLVGEYLIAGRGTPARLSAKFAVLCDEADVQEQHSR